MRIFVAGVSCIGKTTIGTKLAALFAYPFFDLDEEIETFFGTSIERVRKQFLTLYSIKTAFLYKRQDNVIQHLPAKRSAFLCDRIPDYTLFLFVMF